MMGDKILDFEQCRVELDDLFDHLSAVDIVDWHVERTVIEVPPNNGWRKWEVGKDIYIRIHLREQAYPEADIDV